MAQSVRSKFGSVVRAGESYQGKQGLDYTPGVSAERVGSKAIWLGSVILPPHGGRTKAHLHENHETALYLISGDEENVQDKLEPLAGIVCFVSKRTPFDTEIWSIYSGLHCY